jgi:hypothetical protein
MLLTDLMLALVIATILVVVLGVGLRRQPFGAVLAAMFVMLFLATWAGGAWLVPVGPRIAGSYALSFLIVGLLTALLLTAFIPRHLPRTRGEALRQEDARREVAAFVNVFFWIVVAILLIGIVVRYI